MELNKDLYTRKPEILEFFRNNAEKAFESIQENSKRETRSKK